MAGTGSRRGTSFGCIYSILCFCPIFAKFLPYAIVLYNPGGKDTQNGCVLKTLLRLMEDEYRRTGIYGQKQVKEYLGHWRLVDLASDTKYSSPRQKNDE